MQRTSDHKPSNHKKYAVNSESEQLLSEVSKTRANNITLMRLIAAFFVLYGHCYVLSYGKVGIEDPITEFIKPYTAFHMGLPGIGVSIFFALSGFLITKSFVMRGNLLQYMESRILRIFPALLAAVVFCVLLGAAVSELPLYQFFGSNQTWNFLFINGSLVDFWPALPEVFVENPWSGGINGSLWTLSVEFRLYILVGFFGVLGLFRTKRLFLIISSIIALAYIANIDTAWFKAHIMPIRVSLFFLLGSFAYIFSDRIPLQPNVMLVLLAGLPLIHKTAYYDLYHAICFTYLTLLIAYHPILRLPSIDDCGDYSYGVYLYAFPATQLVVYFIDGGKPLITLLLTILITAALALVSWRYIEKPALRYKGSLTRILKY